MSVLKQLNIPHMGSVENAKLLSCIVQEGESFATGDILYEIETDKTASDVEADEPGILVRYLVDIGSELKVGDLIGLWADIGTSPSAIEAALAAREAQSDEPTEPAMQAEPDTGNTADSLGGDAQRFSPFVRRIATEHGVDLATVKGSGPQGRITGEDVLAAAGAAAPASAADGVEQIAHSLRRQAIARRMTQAAAIPTLTADMEIDLTALVAYRESERAAGRITSILGLITHAAISVLQEQRTLNAHWTDAALLRFDAVHLGMAIETDEGLVVPVIRNAEVLDPVGLTDAIAKLAERARTGQLKPADLEGGTFTISNPGSLGPTIRAEALLNPPQIALLGLPGIVRAAIAIESGGDWTVEVRPVIRPSLSFDHRAVDGGPVIAFLNGLKARLEAL